MMGGRAGRLWPLILLAWLIAGEAVAGTNPVTVAADAERIAVWPNINVIHPQRLVPGPDEAADLFAVSDTIAVDSPDRVMGRGMPPWWARLSLHNPASVTLSRLVALEATTQHDVRLFLRDPQGGWRQLPSVADHAQRGFASGTVHPLWPVVLNPGQTAELLLRIEGPAVVRFPVFVLDSSNYAKWSLKFSVAIGVGLGTCLLVILYVIYWHRFLDDASVLLFAIMLAADLVGALWLSGFFSVLLPMVAQSTLSPFGLAAYALLYGCGSLHARLYLKTAEWSPMADRMLLGMGWVWLLMAPWVAVAYPVAARILMVWGGSAVGFVLVVTSARAAMRKVPFSEFIAAAWLSYLVVGLLFTVARATEDPRFWTSSALVLVQPTLVAILFGIAMNQRLLSNRDRLMAVHREAAMRSEHEAGVMHERSLLFAALNHDLRQPLLGVGMYASMLKTASDVHERDALAGKLDSALHEVDDLLVGIQQLAVIHEAAHRPALETYALDNLLAPMVDEYRHRAQAKRITLRYVPTRLLVTTHAPYFLRIVRNVLSNTLRYTERGGRVVVGVRRGGGPRLLIADNGRGMNEDQTRRAFEAFTRFDAQVAIPQGSGLGLFSVRTLAGALGLETTLHSQPGRGTCFTLSLVI